MIQTSVKTKGGHIMAKTSKTYRKLVHTSHVLGLEAEALRADMCTLLNDYRHFVWLYNHCRIARPEKEVAAVLALFLQQEGLAEHQEAIDCWASAHSGSLTEAVCRLMDQALEKTAHYPAEGAMYQYILESVYLSQEASCDMDVATACHLERTAYYQRKKEAQLCMALAFVQQLVDEAAAHGWGLNK